MNAILDFIHDLSFNDLPQPVIAQAKRCLLDLSGVAVAGRSTRLSHIMQGFVRSQYPGEIPMLFAGQTASACGAALYGAMLIDSMDAHDGQVLTKGHVGVSVLPGLLALTHGVALDSREWLTHLVVGYEIATRAGIALHASATDYHTSGAWNGLGVVAMAARLLPLSKVQTREALGAAEFYGPRSQMMRCIDYPTMLKDGSGWGALAGISSALLAQSGFTGAPAVTLADESLSSIWSDLGQRWYILEQYFKAYPVCRWAQPAVEAVRQLRVQLPQDLSQIESIRVFSFHEATRLHTMHPTSTEQAQYSLPFSVACALMDDSITPRAIAETDEGLFHPLRRQLSAKVQMVEEERYNVLFPAERWAHTEILLKDGQRLLSESTMARGNPENPLSDDELKSKFLLLSETGLSSPQQQALYESCQTLDIGGQNAVTHLLSLLASESLSGMEANSNSKSSTVLNN